MHSCFFLPLPFGKWNSQKLKSIMSYWMLWLSKYGIRRYESIHHLQVSFLFRYGIDVKEVPFISWPGGLKLLLCCKCFVVNSCLDVVCLCCSPCVLIALSAVPSAFEPVKAPYFLWEQVYAVSLALDVSIVSCHISRYLKEHTTSHRAAREKQLFHFWVPCI